MQTGPATLRTILAACGEIRSGSRIAVRGDVLRVLIAGKDDARVAILEEGLLGAGRIDIHRAAGIEKLDARARAVDPHAVLIDLGRPDRGDLYRAFALCRGLRRPTALFVEESDSDAVRGAIEAGVSAYIVDSLRAGRVRTVLDIAIRRFDAYEALRAELEEARSRLAERGVVETAKAIIMKQHNVGENEAHTLLRRAAMNQNKKIADIAQSVVAAAAVFEDGPTRS